MPKYLPKPYDFSPARVASVVLSSQFFGRASAPDLVHTLARRQISGETVAQNTSALILSKGNSLTVADLALIPIGPVDCRAGRANPDFVGPLLNFRNA